MKKFNISLPSGQILINMTVNTTNGNNIVFNISDLSPGKSYTIKKSGIPSLLEISPARSITLTSLPHIGAGV
ncbi:MAG: hypothetical protein OIN66_16695 [Candidatus Methanoperedens sp.]|nr:hypothetical protein [Candidatus Methanoperedens sp.]